MHNIPTSARSYHLPKAGSFDYLTIEEHDVAKPKANEVLVKVHAVSLQFVDISLATGSYPLIGPDNLVPCSDMAGEIVAVGPDVTSWKVGDRICSNFATDHVYGDPTPETQATSLGIQAHGVLTEYRTFQAHSLVRIPDHLSFEEASTLPCTTLTAYGALTGLIPLKAGDYVLAMGTGAVSLSALQFAVASGAIVIATSSSDEKLKFATQLGAKHVINYNTTPDWDEEVQKITNGVGVDHVIEVGGSGTLPKSVSAARYGGIIHMIGFVAEKDLDSNALIRQIIRKSVRLNGVYIGSVAQFVQMNRLISANPDTTRPVIDKVFSFEEAKQAYSYCSSQKNVGKVVIKVSKN